MMASRGARPRPAGRDRTGRKPVSKFARKAVVQALELGLFGFRQIEVGEQPPAGDRQVPDIRILDLAEPAHEAGQRRPRDRGWSGGSSGLPAAVRAEIRPLTVMNLSEGLDSAGGMDSPLPILVSGRRRGRRRRGSLSESQGAAGAVARQAPLADGTFQDVAHGGAPGPVLRIRHRRFLPFRRRAGGDCHPAPGRLLPARARSTRSASPRAGR